MPASPHALPPDCLARVVNCLDVLSAFALSLTSSRLYRDVLPLWSDSHEPPSLVSDTAADSPLLASLLLRSASAAIYSSALHTAASTFRHASVVPDALSLREAAAAVDAAHLLRHLPQPPRPSLQHASGPPAGSRCGARGGGRSGPAPKISALQIAVLTRAARAVQVLLGEPAGAQDVMLAPENAEGRMARLDLVVSRLPAAHLGRYTVTEERDGGPARAVVSKQVTVRVADDPTATASPVYACVVSEKACVNTVWLLEMAVLIHDARVCELLLHRTAMRAPRVCLAELLDPSASLCGASYARLGAEPNHSQEVAAAATAAATAAADEVDGARGERTTLSFCHLLSGCMLARASLQIARDFIATSRAEAPSLRAAFYAADYGDAALVETVLGDQPSADSRLAVVERQQWRILYERVRLAQIVASSSPVIDANSQFAVAWHRCMNWFPSDGDCRRTQLEPARDADVLERIRSFALCALARRQHVLKRLSRAGEAR
jgi:hypothetical protein